MNETADVDLYLDDLLESLQKLGLDTDELNLV